MTTSTTTDAEICPNCFRKNIAQNQRNPIGLDVAQEITVLNEKVAENQPLIKIEAVAENTNLEKISNIAEKTNAAEITTVVDYTNKSEGFLTVAKRAIASLIGLVPTFISNTKIWLNKMIARFIKLKK